MIKRKSVSFSIDEKLLKKFETYIRDKNYKTRSKAITDIISDEIVKREYISGKDVVGVITIVYNHHKRELSERLTDIQHQNHKIILSNLHIHLDESNCLEVIVLKSNAWEIEKFRDNLKSIKGVKHCSLNITTTGKDD